jgi:hypothetical protein
MFKTLRKKIGEKNESDSFKSMSFDYKLFTVYHVAMMILFALNPIERPLNQAVFALTLGVSLLATSIFYKIARNWSWPGISAGCIPVVIFNILSYYIFFASAAYMMTPNKHMPGLTTTNIKIFLHETWAVTWQAFNQPIFTPWFLAGAGIVAFNILSSLKLVNLKKDEFEAQCGDRIS